MKEEQVFGRRSNTVQGSLFLLTEIQFGLMRYLSRSKVQFLTVRNQNKVSY